MAEAAVAAVEDYNADSITELPFPDCVRKRPTMYIGRIGTAGITHNIREITDNSLDEVLNGHATKITITLHKDGGISVEDNGRGIPIDRKEDGRSAMTVIFTVLHAGGKFDNDNYKVSSGLNGVGASVVNALSEELICTAYRDGYEWTQKFEKGIAVTDVVKGQKIRKRGTRVYFRPDKSIMGQDAEVDRHHVIRTYQELCFLNPNLTIIIKDEYDNESHTFNYPDGITEYVKHISKSKSIIGDVVRATAKDGDVEVDFAFTYGEGYQEDCRSFCNSIRTYDGGKHVQGFRMSLTGTISSYAETNKLVPKGIKLNGDDAREGLVVIISIRHPSPEYVGQTKSELGNNDVQGQVQRLANDCLGRFLEENPGKAKLIVRKAVDAARARSAAKKARENARKKAKDGFAALNGVGKLADCISKNPAEREIFLVEGDSAGGSCKQGRDRNYQAIFPVRGKILNVESTRLEKVLANKEIPDLINVLGCGYLQDFDYSKLQYHTIILAADADVDGEHINTLFDTFFLRYMPELIENGNIYLACPPLFKAVEGKDTVIYLKDAPALANYLANRAVKKHDVWVDDGKGGHDKLDDESLSWMFTELADLKKLVDAACLNHGITHDLIEQTFHAKGLPVKVLESILSKLDHYEKNGNQITAVHAEEFISVTMDDRLKADLGAVIDKHNEIMGVLPCPAGGLYLTDKGKEDAEEYSAYGLATFLENTSSKGVTISRFKGLGEMNPEQLWETTMNPETRTLIRLTIEDMDETGEICNQLMGKNPDARKEIMAMNADHFTREELDI